MKPQYWYDAIQHHQQAGQSYVLVTVVSAAGSTPRETGSKMVVSDTSHVDTIGGGHLEYACIEKARELLAHGANQTHIESYPLSSKLGQCCGGAVKVLFDVCNVNVQTLAIFGAGHVAKALVPILAQLPVKIRWIDNRESLFPNEVANNVEIVVEEEPETEVRHLTEGTLVLILTHDHQLDYRITKQALKYPALTFVGVIGSDTKAKRFRTKLTHRGYDAAALSRLISPVGELSVPGKLPIEVAVSISAQVIQKLHQEKEQLEVTTVSKEAVL